MAAPCLRAWYNEPGKNQPSSLFTLYFVSWSLTAWVLTGMYRGGGVGARGRDNHSLLWNRWVDVRSGFQQDWWLVSGESYRCAA